MFYVFFMYVFSTTENLKKYFSASVPGTHWDTFYYNLKREQ